MFPTRPTDLRFASRFVVFAIALAALVACKQPLGEGAEEPADGRGDGFALVADGRSLLCDCSKLVPFSARPQYPRTYPTGRSDRCVYNPAGASIADGPLVVKVRKAESKLTFDDTVNALLGSYPKVGERSRAEVADGEALSAVAIGSMGVDLLGVVYLPRVRLVLTAEEHFSARPEKDVPRPDYLDGLAAGAVPACL